MKGDPNQLVSDIENFISGSLEELKTMRALLADPNTRNDRLDGAYNASNFKIAVLKSILEKYK